MLMVFVHHRLHGLQELGKDSSPIFGQSPRLRGNPPNGGWGIVQILSTTTRAYSLKSPQRGVGGLFRSNLQQLVRTLLNPPNGSWGIVQILPSHADDLGMVVR